MRVAVRDGQAEEAPVFGQKGEVDTPRVDGERLGPCASLGRTSLQPSLQLLEETEEIPVPAAVDVEHPVGKAVQLADREASVSQGAPDGAAAFSADIEGEHRVCGHLNRILKVIAALIRAESGPDSILLSSQRPDNVEMN